MKINRNFIVTINRATAFGVTQCTGELFEAHGFQFCITNSVDNQIFGAIELSTGTLAYQQCVFDFINEESCVRNVKRWIKKNGALFNDETFEAARMLLKMHSIEYPLNKTIEP